MSKKNKGLSGKSGKKNPVKKAVKPPAKKHATKKTVAKPAAKAKKPAAPVAKSSAKKAMGHVKASAVSTSPATKRPASKKVISKPSAKKVASKKASTVSKVVAKPLRKAQGPASKPASKKIASKGPVARSAAPKKVDAKKASKPVAKQMAKAPVAKAPVAKKPIAKEKEKPVKPAPAITKATPPKEMPKPVPAEPVEKKATDVFSKKPSEKRSNDVLAITNTIPVKPVHEISASKIASISHSITNPIKRTDSYAVKPEKEPPGKFELEFVVHSSPEMLYEFLSSPSGLSEWFCDDLNIRNGIYTFIWEDQLQQARLLKTVEQQLVRFQWVDKTDGSYFEFRIQRDDLTNDLALIITDFADSVGDRESSKLLWNSQIEKLMHVIGSIF